MHLGHAEAKAYYDGVCNGVIWPLFHYLTDRLPLDPGEWSAYCEVNERFAAAVAREYRDGDVVWIHDYHLLLVPGLLRAHLLRQKQGRSNPVETYPDWRLEPVDLR